MPHQDEGSFKADQIGGNDWDEWRRYVLSELRRHNKEMEAHVAALERHLAQDVISFKGIGDQFGRMNTRLAYFSGAVAAIVFAVELVFKLWKG